MARALLSASIAIPSKGIETVVLLSDSTAIPNRGYYGLLSNPPLRIDHIMDGFTSTIFQGATGAEIRVESGYKVKIKMALDGVKDSRGIIQWEDDGKEYDNYSNSISFRGMTSEALETLLASDSEETYYLSTPITNGFYPFGMGFATNQNYPVSISGGYLGKDVDVFGKLRRYKIKCIPAVEDIYTSLNEATAISGCTRILNGWSIGSSSFPFGKFSQSNNDEKRIIQLGGNSSELVDTTRLYGDVAKISIECTEEQARQILQYFTKTMRGTEKTATFPSIYNMFGRRYENITTATVKLFSNIIEIEHKSASVVQIGFKLQMVGL
jgi:hypothetical protein